MLKFFNLNFENKKVYLINFSFNSFTLSEVLITLAIIGIVASLTIPSVIVKYQKHQTIVKLKKIYSELSNAVNQSSITNGTPDKWEYDLTGKDFFNKYLKNYLSVAKTCPDNTTAKQCFGIEYTAINKKKNLSSVWRIFTTKTYYVVLNDGSILFIRDYDSSRDSLYKDIAVDINGVKKPNTAGIDFFVFDLSEEEKKLYPAGFDRTREDILENSCGKKVAGGVSCAALIIKDNWQIKDDYPW